MPTNRAEIEQLLALAKSQNDPVGIEHFELELLRLTNPEAAARLHAMRIARDRANWPHDD